jgi:hypothetical protein
MPAKQFDSSATDLLLSKLAETGFCLTSVTLAHPVVAKTAAAIIARIFTLLLIPKGDLTPWLRRWQRLLLSLALSRLLRLASEQRQEPGSLELPRQALPPLRVFPLRR